MTTNTSAIDVSVVIPAYKSALLIGQTLDSILATPGGSMEVLVIDDGSPDNTADIVSAYGSPVQLVRQANGGIAAARNAGLRLARGRYIAFCDHDDIWHPDKLRAQLAVLSAHPEVGGVFGEFKDWDGSTAPEFDDDAVDPDDWVPGLSGWIYPELLLTNWVLFSTAVFRREVFETVGLFDPSLPPADDWDMAVRISRKYQLVKLRAALALYRRHPLQTSRKPMARDFQSEMRDRFMSQFGPRGPDGRSVDLAALADRQFRSHFVHGHVMFSARMYRNAAQSFAMAWRRRKSDWRSAVYWVAATVLSPADASARK